MKTTLATLLAILSLQCSAQKLVIDEVDKFTKQHNRQTSYESVWRKVGLMQYVNISCKKAGNEVTMFVNINADAAFSIRTGSKMYILLDDDNTVTLDCIEGCRRSEASSYTGERHSGKASFDVPLESVDILKTHEVKAIRIEQKSKYFDHKDYDVKNKYSSVISDELKLLTE